MRRRPEEVIGEILGDPAASMREPVNAGYACPYINDQCTKRSHQLEGPYPVCSVWHFVKSPRLITTCPVRFFGADIMTDVVAHCWPGAQPENPKCVHEVGMEKFGTVDMVIADHDEAQDAIRQFVSVELQAVDCTGSVVNAYLGILNSDTSVEVAYGINWANVRKRYIDQLVAKSFYHHAWGTRIVAVMQTPLYIYLREHIQFDELSGSSAIDVIFLLYDYVRTSEGHDLVFDRAVGTSHSSLMTHTLYQSPPDRATFTDKILKRLTTNP